MNGEYTLFDNSMNGNKTLSDGISIWENGVISNVNSIHSVTGNFSNLSSQELTDHSTDISGNTDRIIALETVDTNTGTRLTNLETDVSGNKISISTNTTDISMNVIDISQNTFDIGINFDAIEANGNLIFDLSGNVSNNDADILAIQNNVIFDGILGDVSSGNISMTVGKSITQTGVTHNELQDTTISNLVVNDSMTFPSTVLIPSSTTTGEHYYNNDGFLLQSQEFPSVNPNTFRDTFFTSITVEDNLTMTNPAGTATLKKMIVDETAMFNNSTNVALNQWLSLGEYPSLVPANRLAFHSASTTNFSYIDYGLLGVIFRSQGKNEKMRLTDTGKLSIRDDFSTINGKSMIIGDGININQQRLRLYHSDSHSFVDFGSGNLFFRNNTHLNLLEMRSIDNLSIFNYDVEIKGALTGPTITGITDRLTDLEDQFTTHGDYQTLTEQVQTNKDDIVTKANHTNGTMYSSINLRSSVNHGYFTDYLHNSSTNDFDVRLQLRNNIVANGLGTLDVFGSFNVTQNLSGPTINTINTRIQTLEDNKDEHNNDAVEAAIISLQTEDTQIKARTTALEGRAGVNEASIAYNAYQFYGDWTRIDENSFYTFTIQAAALTSVFGGTNSYGQAYGDNLHYNHTLQLTWFLRTSNYTEFSSVNDIVFTVGNNSIDPNFRNGICSSFKVETNGDVTIRLKTGSDTIFSSYFENFSPDFDSYISVGGGQVERLVRPGPEFWNLTNAWMRFVITK